MTQKTDPLSTITAQEYAVAAQTVEEIWRRLLPTGETPMLDKDTPKPPQWTRLDLADAFECLVHYALQDHPETTHYVTAAEVDLVEAAVRETLAGVRQGIVDA